MALARATKRADAATVARFLYEEIFAIFGPPETILTDRGSHFNSQLVKATVEQVQTRHNLTTAYNPRCNGLTERFNRTLVQALERCSTTNPRR